METLAEFAGGNELEVDGAGLGEFTTIGDWSTPDARLSQWNGVLSNDIVRKPQECQP